MPELSSVVESAQAEYQGEVVEINFNDSSSNGCYLSGGKSVMDSYEDPDWWEEAVKFADSIENIESASEPFNLVSSPLGSLLLVLLSSVSPIVTAYWSSVPAGGWWRCWLLDEGRKAYGADRGTNWITEQCIGFPAAALLLNTSMLFIAALELA